MPEPQPSPIGGGGMPEDPMMGGDPMAGGAPDAEMPEGPMMGSGMPEDPNMDASMGDENEGGDDKKKEIQKLAGELSELLHTYNEENGDDEELNKYVKGMIDAQTDGERKDEEEPDMGGDEDMENPDEMPEEGDEKMEEPQTEEPKMEGRKITKKQLKEEFAQACKQEKESEARVNKKTNTKKVNQNNPFLPPKIK